MEMATEKKSINIPRYTGTSVFFCYHLKQLGYYPAYLPIQLKPQSISVTKFVLYRQITESGQLIDPAKASSD